MSYNPGYLTRSNRGNLSSAAWGVAGIGLAFAAATFTDTSTANSGTAATAVGYSIGIPKINASNTGVVVTNSATLYIAGDPVGTADTANATTLTNAYGIWNVGKSRFDGQVRAGDGTAAAPSYSFTSDPDTGFYWTTSGRVNLATDGVVGLRFAFATILGPSVDSFIQLPANGSVNVTAAGSNQSIAVSPSGTGFTTFVGASQTSNLGSVPSAVTYGGLYLGVTTPALATFTVASNGSETLINAPVGSGAIKFSQANVERARFAGTSGNLLLSGLTTDGTGVLQLQTHTTSAGGIAFGSATANIMWTNALGQLNWGDGSSTSQFLMNSGGGNNCDLVMQRANTTFFQAIQDGSGGVIFKTGSSPTTAQTLSSAQNATFAGTVKAAGFIGSSNGVGLTQASTTTLGKSITVENGLVTAFA